MNLDQDRVPASLAEALELLGAALNEEERSAWTSMTAARMFDLQAKIARILRSDWSLLLIDAYWRKRNNESIPVEDLVREYLEE